MQGFGADSQGPFPLGQLMIEKLCHSSSKWVPYTFYFSKYLKYCLIDLKKLLKLLILQKIRLKNLCHFIF